MPIASTLAGGFLAIHFRRWLPILLAAGAGVLMGAAFLDLLPEALTLGAQSGLSAPEILGVVLGSFLLFFSLDVFLQVLGKGGGSSRGILAGRFAGTLLVLHSFRDGMAIGASFAASPAAGYAVALGVGAHDFGDGLNTVLLTTRGEQARPVDYLFLVADALAPVLGGVFALWSFSSVKDSAFLLAAAAGFFLQMAGSDLLPELKRSIPTERWTVPAVLAGSAMIYGANLLLRNLR